MKVQGMTSGFVFSRNPVILRHDWPDDNFDRNGGVFTLSMDGVVIYEGRFFPPLNIDISEILDAYTSTFKEVPDDNGNPLVNIEDEDELACRRVYCSFEYDGVDSGCDFMVIPGGISRQNYRRYFGSGKDVFESRLFDTGCNPFMSTRSDGWCLAIKETELYPLYFFIRHDQGCIDVVEGVSGRSITFDNLATGVWAFDVDALRRRFMEEYGVLSSMFDVYIERDFSCRIVVERSMAVKERYLLKFRNSFGVFEIMELVGDLSVTPEYKEAADIVFDRYDTVSGGFYADRGRVACTRRVVADVSPAYRPDVCFLMDMLGSDEVYLLGFAPDPVKVIPSVEDFSYRLRPENPGRLKLTFDISDPEVNIMQDLEDRNAFKRPRLFSEHFDKQFN